MNKNKKSEKMQTKTIEIDLSKIQKKNNRKNKPLVVNKIFTTKGVIKGPIHARKIK
ncbi:MAG: hypothetical protein IKM43_01205 [Clostridia bacterium]|nr:hypothetical protein [Clostridia bacterium]